MTVTITEGPPSGLRKAAILLVLLGDDVASRVYRSLPEQSVERLTQEIARMGNIAPDTGLLVLEEYHALTLTQDSTAQGGTSLRQRPADQGIWRRRGQAISQPDSARRAGKQ